MGYTVEKISGNQVKITFEISADKFGEAVQKAYLKVRGRLNVPGFRKGKAPRRLIETMYGENVFYDDAFDILFPDEYEAAVKENDLQVVDRPEVDEVKQIGVGKDLIFSVNGIDYEEDPYMTIVDGKLYFGCGTFKNVFRQLTANPKVEILAMKGDDFMRYDGEAVVVKDDALLAKVREAMPGIMAFYDKNGWEMGLFYLRNGQAEIRAMMDQKEVFEV